jgi:hypothetical protein
MFYISNPIWGKKRVTKRGRIGAKFSTCSREEDQLEEIDGLYGRFYTQIDALRQIRLQTIWPWMRDTQRFTTRERFARFRA